MVTPDAFALLMAGTRDSDTILAADRQRKENLRTSRAVAPKTFRQHVQQTKREDKLRNDK